MNFDELFSQPSGIHHIAQVKNNKQRTLMNNYCTESLAQ